MRCETCGAHVGRWSESLLCPACFAVTRAALPTPTHSQAVEATWLWTSDSARTALATGRLGVILRAYRSATATSQRRLAERLGYDTTYISMIETGRRDVTEVGTLLRFAHALGIPAHTLGIAEPDDIDFVSMLQFAESTLRLAVLARQSGHGTEAVNELWPIAVRLESRVAAGHTERDVMHLLARIRAELGVSLGYILPEERLASAARWTWRALTIAEHLDDPHLHATALRVHGNELRKAGHVHAAVVRLQHAVRLTNENGHAPILVQLLRATAEQGDAKQFDRLLAQAHRVIESTPDGTLGSTYAVHETQLRGLAQTGRPTQALALIDHAPALGTTVPAQWQAMLAITTGQILLTTGENAAATEILTTAIPVAETHRLPHQLQRIIRTTHASLPEIRHLAGMALHRLVRPTDPGT